MWRDANTRLIPVAAAGLLAGVGAAWLVSTAGPAGASFANVPFAVPVVVLVGWSFIGSGLLAWRSRPDTHLPVVLIFTGFAWFASMLPDAHNPVLFTAGEAVQLVFYVGLVYLVLSFPYGRLQGGLDRWLVAATIVLVTIGRLAWLLFADSRAVICTRCPANLLEMVRDDVLARTLFDVQLVISVPVAVVGLGLLAVRWRRASHAQRHAVMPVVVTGAVAFAAVVASAAAIVVGAGSAAAVLSRVGWYAAAAIPVAVLAVFIQRRLAQSAVAGLLVELGGRGTVADLREALSRALGDPSLALAYWFAAESRYVDRDGKPVELPGPDSGRRSTVVERDGQPVAVLIHDPVLEHNAKLVDSVCAAAGLALENERLAAELRARLVELQVSRVRLVTTADEARRRIERDLHDGAQQQLVALRISLGLARQLVASSPDRAADLLAQTEHQAAGALEELRELARGIYPPLLADLGLRAALDAQAHKAALAVTVEASGVDRYPQEIEAAVYFCVLEAVQNVAKYAQASAARITLCHDGQDLEFTVEDDGTGFDQASTPKGTGLQGLSDRLAALGGTLDITSALGHGTRVKGRVPATAR